MPDAPKDADQANPDVAANDVFHRVDPDDPALATKGGAGEITEDHTGAQGGVGDQAHVATARSPGVVDTAEEHGFEDQQQGADAKQDQVITNDVGHLVFVAPVLGEERGVVLQDFWAAQGVIKAAQTKHGRADQVQHTHHEEWVEVCDLTARTHAVAEGGYVGEQDQTLLVHGLVEGEVAHLEQHHGAGPEDHQASVGHVGAEQAAGEVDQAGVTGPPGIPCGVEVFAPDNQV